MHITAYTLHNGIVDGEWKRIMEITAKLATPAWKKHLSNLLSDAEWDHQSIGFRHNPLLNFH